jgi:imidazolonepropionase
MVERADDPWGAIRDAVVAVSDGFVRWVGPEVDAPARLLTSATRTLDLRGGWVTPGLVDAHTHLVFGGNRADEWERRLQGATYEEIARAGGGILSTVRATRAADRESLLASAEDRLTTLVDHGCTTVEI